MPNKKINCVKVSALLSVLTAAVLSAGCASNKFSITENGSSPIAILCVSGNTHVPYYSEEVRDDEYGDEDGVLSNALNGFFGRSNPEIQTAPDRVEYAEDAFRRLVTENAGVEVVPKETVLASKTYDDIGKYNLLAFTDVKIRGEGYKYIDDIGAKKAQAIMQETGANSCIFLDFVFKKYIKGNGDNLKADLGAMGTMNVIMYNSRGRKVIDDQFTVISNESVEMYMTKYDKDAMVELFPDVIDQLINRFIVKYL